MEMKTALARLVLAFMILALSAIGCAVPPPAEPAATPAAPTPMEAQPEEAAGGTLRIGVEVDPVSLDPHHYKAGGVDLAVIHLLTDGLVTFDRDMNIIPQLATSWEWEDNTTLRFELREGVTFHDGTPWDAEAAKYNFERIMEAPEVASYFGRLESVDVVDDYTIVLKLSEPYAPFLRNLASPVGGMVSPEAAEALGEDLSRQVVGTGAFKLEEWLPREQLVLVRNPDYWGTAPKLEKVIFRPLPEESTRMLAFQAGELDVIKSPSPSQVPVLEQAEDSRVVRTTQLRNLWLGIENGDPVLDDVRVRQAIAHAIDRDALVDFVAEGLVAKANSLIPPTMMDLPEPAYPYDPERAKELLAEAGYEDGLTLKLWAPEGRYFKGKEIAEAIQQQLKDVGIETDLQIWEWGAYNNAILEHNQQLWIQGWGFVTGDPEAMRALFSTDGPFNSFNLADDRIDALFDAGVATVGEAEREAVYAEMQTRLIEELATVVPIYFLVGFYGVRDNVHDFYLHPLELIDLSETWVE
jgi:peptide/nickel transport system substrate-binding protein